MSHDTKHTVEADPQPSISESWLGRQAPYLLLLVYLFYCTLIAMEVSAGARWFGGWLDWVSEMLPIMAGSLVVLMGAALTGVVLKIVGQVVRRVSGITILRTILGEPSWWRTWYPRALRRPTSVWDRLPPALKVTRTAVWLGLLLLPAGMLLAVLVLPTFQIFYEILGLQFPSMMSAYAIAVTVGGYLSPLIIGGALVQAWRWRVKHGLPSLVAFNALFSGSQDFWRDTDAQKLLMPQASSGSSAISSSQSAFLPRVWPMR